MSDYGIETLKKNLRGLGYACDVKRGALLSRGGKQARLYTHLHVIAGVMALLSGAAMTGVYTELLNGIGVKVISAVLVFSSGLVSLITNNYANSHEREAMFSGAAAFLELRERADLEAERVHATAAQLHSSVSKLRMEYTALSQKYDRHLPVAFHRAHYAVSPAAIDGDQHVS